MSLFFGRRQQQREASLSTLEQLQSLRGRRVGSVNVTHDTALRHSAVWAALRLRANLISSLPVDVFRVAGALQVEVGRPPLLIEPSPGWSFGAWMWATQFDLDRYGNTIGLIVERDALGLPKRVDLWSAPAVTMRGCGDEITSYRYSTGASSVEYGPEDVWHERQYRIAGSPVGLDPIAYAAWSIGGYLSAQEFALDYFATGGHPSGVLRNTENTVVGALAKEAKASFKAATYGRDVFVTGKDWEWTPAGAPEAATTFLESQAASSVDIARYLDVPADVIDAAVQGSSLTYANIVQRNLQLLIYSLGAPIKRREDALSAATPAPRFVKLNSDALLRMDPETRTKLLLAQVAAKTRVPSEVRAIDDLAPYTDEQLAELAFFAQLGKPTVPTTQQAAKPQEVP